ncbi:MAG TPA: prolipoprotein diacylglyceryl transferase family protein [Kofleriaceae bacterium]
MAATELPTSCAHPTVRGISTYTVFGFVGYGVANIVGAILSYAWQLSLSDRLITFLLPPLSFLAVVYLARRIVRKERIVFYQTTIAGVATVAIASAITGGQLARCVDITVVGIGIFLVFGRIGCFSVACCHGRPARFGIVYGADHVKLGFWSRWSGRRLWPVQLVESAASLALVVAALVFGWTDPGRPALIYAVGYGLVRFALENVRGDSARPQVLGVSEAQWTTVATLIACALWRPGILTAVPAALVVVAALALIARRRNRELWSAPHLRAIDTSCALALRDGAPANTPLGLAISCHGLADGRLDWVLSSTHAAWSTPTARRVAGALWPRFELVEGRLAGVIHVITEAA